MIDALFAGGAAWFSIPALIGTGIFIIKLAGMLMGGSDDLDVGGGTSASGVSDTINPGYARLYAEDLPLTGEQHTYLSRNASGDVLYTTHHFTVPELHDLLEAAGFDEIRVTTERETSSRRPDEAAFFLYATCRASS